ncbi:MAG: zinc ribbon domain-containing protein [Firmicutes bacterium]|nr:zinc ribbon domain-containing protein [Bacillota bacterium]
MFCGKCGNKNEEGMRFCGVCGSPTATHSSGDTVKTVDKSELDLGGFAKFDATNENTASVTVAGLLLDASLVFRGLAVLIFIAFILPLYSVGITLLGTRIASSVGGFSLAFGGRDANGTFWGVVLFLIPIVMFLLFQFWKEIKKSVAPLAEKLFMIEACLCVLGLIALFAARNSLDVSLVSVRPSVGFVLSLILYLIALAVSVCFVAAAKKK